MYRVLLSAILWIGSFAAIATDQPIGIPGEGLQAEGRGEWQQALSTYLNQLLKTPHRIDLWLRVASIEHHLKNYQLAIDAYHHAILLQPTNPVFHKTLSEIYAELDQPTQALIAINEAVKLKPNDMNYWLARAKIANWNKQASMALESYQRVLLLSQTQKTPFDNRDVLAQIKKLEIKNQEKPISLFEQLKNQANEAAYFHQYAKAENILKKAILLKPKDADLYKKLSEIYVMDKKPQLALDAINKAINLAPMNISYWRAKGQLASWVVDKDQMQSSYEQILKLKPCDEDAMLNLAHALAWQGKTDAAIKAYQELLSVHPRAAEGWIQYAETLSWTGDYIGACQALDHYKQLKGETTAYRKVHARVLALIGRFKSALAINTPLLQENDQDIYVLSTEVTALVKAFQMNKAIDYLNKADRIDANDPQLKGLRDVTLTPIRSTLNVEADYTAANDTTRIADFPVSAQYFVSPTTSLLLQGLDERAIAAPNSRLGPVNRNGSIYDESAKVGFATQIEALNLKGLVGGLKIQDGNNHAIYDASANTNLGETAQIGFGTLHDLYRPYLVPQTPRLISLQVMETRYAAFLQWQPSVEKYMNMTFSYSNLSDNNDYVHLNLWPKMRVYASEHWLATMGVDGDFWHYRRRPFDGYYSPIHFNGYEGTMELYYVQSENIGVGFSGGFGMQRDETFPHYFYEEDLAAQVFIGIFTQWQLQLRAGYTLRENPVGKYDCWSTAIALTRRF